MNASPYATHILAGTAAGLLKIASTDPTRPHLIGIHFDPEGFAVATNGAALIAARVTPFDGPAFLVPSDVVAGAVKSIPVRHRSARLLGVSATAMETEHGGQAQYLANPSTFPDWRRVVPRTVSGKPARFDTELLEKLRDALALIYGTKGTPCPYIGHNGDSAALLSTGPEALVVIMPLRETRGASPPAPAAYADAVRVFLIPPPREPKAAPALDAAAIATATQEAEAA